MPHAAPDFAELNDHPELAVLSILEQTLETALSVLIIAHPGLRDEERPYWVKCPTSELVAQHIVARAATLSGFVRNYHAALLVEQTQRTGGGAIATEEEF